MERISRWLAATLATLTALFCALNWSALNTPSILNLGFTQVQAPLGTVLLGLTGAFLVVLLAVMVYSRLSGMRESRVLHRDLQAAHALADSAEASRFGELQRLVTGEFRTLNERCNAIESALHARRPDEPALRLR